jgi:hypothetical protein
MQNQPSLPQHRKRWREGMMGFAIIPFAIVAVYFSVIRFHSLFLQNYSYSRIFRRKHYFNTATRAGRNSLPLIK